MNGTRDVNMAMYAALSTCAIAITMVTEGNLVGVNFSRGEKLGVALLLFGAFVSSADDLSFSLVGYCNVFANNMWTALFGSTVA